jgi:mannose-1-phosphate guanylyltransferase
MSKVKGLVLCGGPGTRLRPITYYFQKVMVPVGLKQKPLLEYVVRLFRFHGIKDLTFLVDYKAEQIINYFNDGRRFDVKISYIRDTPELKGTAGSVLNAYAQGLISLKNTLLVYYGDILTNMNLKDLLKQHAKQRASATVALASGFTVKVGLADLNGQGRIKGFVEKPTLEKPVSVGILVFNGKTLKDMEHSKGDKPELDLMRDVVPYLIEGGKLVCSYLSDAFWYDIGSTEAYEKLNPKVVEDSLSYLFK